VSYEQLKASLGLDPTQIDTGFRTHPATGKGHERAYKNKRSPRSFRLPPAALEDLTHLNPKNRGGKRE